MIGMQFINCFNLNNEALLNHKICDKIPNNDLFILNRQMLLFDKKNMALLQLIS